MSAFAFTFLSPPTCVRRLLDSRGSPTRLVSPWIHPTSSNWHGFLESGIRRLDSTGTSTDEASPLTLSLLAAFLRLWGACLAPALHVDRCGPKDLVTSPKMQHSISILSHFTSPCISVTAFPRGSARHIISLTRGRSVRRRRPVVPIPGTLGLGDSPSLSRASRIVADRVLAALLHGSRPWRANPRNRITRLPSGKGLKMAVADSR